MMTTFSISYKKYIISKHNKNRKKLTNEPKTDFQMI